MTEVYHVVIFWVVILAIGMAMDLWSRRRSAQKEIAPTAPRKTGEYRLQPVRHEGKLYMCLQTEWEYMVVRQEGLSLSGEKVRYWKWSTMAEIKHWHATNYGE